MSLNEAIINFSGSFFAFKLKKNKLKDNGGAGNPGNTSLHQLIDNKHHHTSPHHQGGGGHLNQGYASNTFNRVKKMPTQKPDIIERQVRFVNLARFPPHIGYGNKRFLVVFCCLLLLG